MSNKWPHNHRQQLFWLETRIDSWVSNSDTIGLTEAQAADIAQKVSAARTALDSAQAARAAAIATTAAWHAAATAMAEAGGAGIKTIRAFAVSSEDSNVYLTAQINPPAPPSPAPPPTMPEGLTTELENEGAILLKWKSTNPAAHTGVSFVIYRKLATESAYTQIGTTGEKKFSDETIPAGTHWAAYMVRAVRGGKLSPFSEPATVNLGISGEEGQPLSLAA